MRKLKLYLHKDHGHSCTTELLEDHEYCAVCWPGTAAMEYIAERKRLNDEAKVKLAEVIRKQKESK